jgi:hypothetical protein
MTSRLTVGRSTAELHMRAYPSFAYEYCLRYVITDERPDADSAALTDNMNNMEICPIISSGYVAKDGKLDDMLSNITSSDVMVGITFFRLEKTPAMPVTNRIIAVVKWYTTTLEWHVSC